MNLSEFFSENTWKLASVLDRPSRPATLESYADLPLQPITQNLLSAMVPNGIYCHQKIALQRSLAGENICLTTGTASGKSLVFQAAALDILQQDPHARVIAIYPMKALGNEQADRWEKALAQVGMAEAVGRVDGNVPIPFRLAILERSRVVVFTPDIMHAWLFSNLGQPQVAEFLKNVKLVVIDEVHTYTGVFGSNSAYLFRRLQHIMSLLGARPRFICASATIARPNDHLQQLVGQTFTLIGPENDSSPRYPVQVFLAAPPHRDHAGESSSGGRRFLDEVVKLLTYLARQTDSRFIAFVDSRKQVELITSILARALREQAADAEPGPEAEMSGLIESLDVLPYRAGYEDADRRRIQERLTEGKLSGVISTSALELGIDIPQLDTCVLIGLPGSSTSLGQRIGRIGRHGPGVVIAVHGGDVFDEAIFSNPERFFDLPLAESALYLENEYIQYIHALCLARNGGEHDQAFPIRSAGFESPIPWPEHFLELCRLERSGQTPPGLTFMKTEAGERPNYTFPLRDVESQFRVELKQGPNTSSLGSLSFGQLMREAYPGAIYYYATIPYRVTRVNLKGKKVQVRREKRYVTRPLRTPTAIFPRFTAGQVHSAALAGAAAAAECDLLVRDSIYGMAEQRGRAEVNYPYPLQRELGFAHSQPFFTRNYFTTGVVLTHPALSAPGVNLETLARLFYEAYLILLPFERQELGCASDHLRAAAPPYFPEGAACIVLYDQTYGSLRLSGRLLAGGSRLAQVLFETRLLAAQAEEPLSPPTLAALDTLLADTLAGARSALQISQPVVVEQPQPPLLRVLQPGSKGLLARSNEEFWVERIVVHPGGVCYEGIPASLVGSSATSMPAIEDIIEIPGESIPAVFDPETNTCTPLTSTAAASQWDKQPAAGPMWIDSTRLRAVLLAELGQEWAARLDQAQASPLALLQEAAAALFPPTPQE